MKIRNNCRSCNSNNLRKVLSLGKLYISDFVTSRQKGTKEPLDLVVCRKCSLVQLKHTAVDPEKLYRNYWYKSGMNKTMINALSDIANKVEKSISFQKEDIVLDIGANDGTLLRAYKNRRLTRVGFEPARNLIPEAEVDTDKIINNFFSALDFQKAFPFKKAKAITSIAMFYDLEEPNSFVSDIKKILDPKGIWIIQMAYLPSMLELNAFDNICFKPGTLLLGDNKSIEQLTKNSLVINEKGGISKIKKTMQRFYDGKMIKIKPAYLEPIIATPEHPIKIVRKEVLRFKSGQLRHKVKKYFPEWVPLNNVRRGDWVVVPILKHQYLNAIDLTKFNKIYDKAYRRGLISLPLNKEIAWMLGLYVAEGHTNEMIIGNIIIHFTLNKKETSYAKRIRILFEKLGYKTSIRKVNRNNSLDVGVSCTALARAFKKWFGKNAIEKKIPDFLMFSTEEIKQAFLQGLFAGDGYIKGNKVHFHTSSKILALQTQLVLASLGAMVGISYVKPYIRYIRGGIVKSKDSWQLRGSSTRLASIFGFKHNGNVINHVIVNNEYVLIPVKNVDSELYKGKVYNLETEDNTYLVSNAIVHNCHEHIEYYSLLSLENLLKNHNLAVYDVELNDINGGSFRVYVKNKDNKSLTPFSNANKRLLNLRTQEKKLALHTMKPYSNFNKRVLLLKKKCVDFIKKEVKKGKTISVYGASTKGNTLLQYYNLDRRLIKSAAERNPNKWGLKTIGTNIPIVSEVEVRKQKPDFLLILPWHFLKEFLDREKDYLKSGGHFIIPLPAFKII